MSRFLGLLRLGSVGRSLPGIHILSLDVTPRHCDLGVVLLHMVAEFIAAWTTILTQLTAVPIATMQGDLMSVELLPGKKGFAAGGADMILDAVVSIDVILHACLTYCSVCTAWVCTAQHIPCNHTNSTSSMLHFLCQVQQSDM